MGIVGEFYRVEDEVIDYYRQHPEKSNDFFDENFSYVDGKYHNEPDRHYYTDKAWAVAIFLMQTCDKSANKVTSKIKGQLFDPSDWDTPSYIKSTLAKEIANALENITEAELRSAYNKDKMLAQKIYGAESVDDSNWEDYHLIYTKNFISAFQAAKKYGHGIVINKC